MEERTPISVALCTYNGERYLLEQLTSIANQQRQPDELIIVDDGSRDATVTMIQQFSKAVSFPVHLLINEKNLGSTKSFERAIMACTGAIIVLSDQDDVWRDDRLAMTEAYFKEHPDMDVVFSDAEIIDDNSMPQGRKIWEEVRFTPEARERWSNGEAHLILFYGYVVTGATMAIRRSALPLLLPFPTHVAQLIHDAWMSLIMALHNKIGYIDDCLISYRQHTQQQVGFKAPRPKVTLRDRFTRGREEKLQYVAKMAEKYQQLYALLSSRSDIDPQKLRVLRHMKEHLAQRTRLPAPRVRRLLPVIRELSRGSYQLFQGHWWLTVIGDLLEA